MVSGSSGVKVAIRPVAASRTTDDATTDVVPGAAVTVNVAALTVSGSMREPEGTLKVALIAVIQTPEVPAPGLVEDTETLASAIGPAVRNVQT